MTDKEKILAFEKYLREKNIENDKIGFYLKVVNLLVSQVLFYFSETLETIDTYCFEEFTDMVVLIDSELGGREGIPRIMDAMLELTEFLKINKFIKGGKIAYYKRMFSNTEYYVDKYDKFTGKKDDTKEFIKYALVNSLSINVVNAAQDINLYDIVTLDRIDKMLNDVPFSKKEMCDDIRIIKEVLINIKLLEEKNGQIETTKKGRAVSRLDIEQRYAALMYLFLYQANWNYVIKKLFGGNPEIKVSHILKIFSAIFSKTDEVSIKLDSITELDENKVILEISTPSFRIARAESFEYGTMVVDVLINGFGLIEIENKDINEIVYRTTPFGRMVFQMFLKEYAWSIKEEINSIGYLIKNRSYTKAEKAIIEYISTYGDNIVVWDYLGQILLLNRNYTMAYTVLKHAYETSSKKGKAAKSALYHLVLCCRKLKLNDDIQSYETKLQSLQ